MKHMNRLLCGLLFSFTLMAGSVPAMADENVISTKVSADGNVVTVKVTAEAGEELTSGRVVVSYDENALTLKAVETADAWEAEDVNTEETDSVSYAFADGEGSDKGGDVMTLTFLAKEDANGKKTTIETEVKELYREDEVLAQAGAIETDDVTPSWTVDTETPDEENDENGVNGTVSTNQSLNEVLEQQIAEAAEGSSVVVTVGDAEQVISANVFEELKGRDVTVEFHMENGVVWRINGKNIKNAKEIDLGVVLNSTNIPEAVFDMIEDDAVKYQVQFALDFDGDLGGTFELSIPVGKEGAGYFGNLYYYNPAKNALEYMQTDTVDADGMVTYSFTHASDYDIAVSETNGAEVNTVKTGDQTPVAGYVLLVCGAVLILAFGVRRMKKTR